MRRSLLAATAALAAALLSSHSASAQNCRGVPNFEACLDAVGAVPVGATTPRDPSRVIDDIFRTSDTPPLYGPQLTFGVMDTHRTTLNSAGCAGGVSSSSVPGYPATTPTQYTAYQCVDGISGAPDTVATYVNGLDWRWSQTYRVHPDGTIVTDMDGCGGDTALCGYQQPWRGSFVFDLQGPANRVVVFPITDHVDNCLEAFEYSVYLTNNPDSTSFVGDGERPDPMRWNRAVLVRAYLRGWTNNSASTGTVADMAAHPLATGADTPTEAIADSLATVWALPCGLNFRYVAVMPGNYGNPDQRCAFHSAEYEFDAVAGLNEDGTAICADRDMDGFRDHACGGNDCDDSDPAVNPGATEDCRATRDLNCDGHVSACPTDLACVGGLCVTQCVEGACADSFTCTHVTSPAGSYCVPATCAGVNCPAGQICGPAGCQAPCDGAVCPVGQVCRGGACTDLCGGVMCPTNQHCEAGVCTANCSCLGCAAGETCNATTGRCDSASCSLLPCPPEQRNCAASPARCVTSFCDGVVCPLGQRCDATAMACVPDRCFGISCTPGFACNEGRCVVVPDDAAVSMDATVGDGGGRDGGAGFDGGDSARGPGDGASGDGRSGSGDATRDAGTAANTDGCGCRTPGGSAPSNSRGDARWALLLAGVAVLRRRARR